MPRKKYKATLSSTVSIIVENFLPTRRQQYLLQNSQQSLMYCSYHSHIPSYLHNWPRSIIIHCLDRQTNSAKISAESIHDVDCENGIFEIEKAPGSKHRVDFGISSSSEKMPSCTRRDWLRYHIPCKHFLASSLTNQLGSGTTFLQSTCKVHISPQTPRDSTTTSNHLMTI